MVVCVGESVMLPAPCGIVATVRVELPAVAVIVTEVALLVVQLKVVAIPVVIDVGFAVNEVICGTAPVPTCTVAVCGALLPPAPVAVAVYVVVCVGESLTVPDAWLLVVTVRVELPAVAVIVIDVAFVVVQVSVVA